MSTTPIEPVNNFETNARRAHDVGTTRTSRGSAEPHGRSPPGRRLMDIEDVVLWAIRDELPKRQQEGGIGGPLMSTMFGICDLGTRVDSSGGDYEPGFPLAMGGPHPDALRVEAAIAALERFKDYPVDVALDLGPDFAADPADEAEAMRRAFASIDAIVIRAGRLRQRPFWHSATQAERVTQPNGRPVVLRWETRASPTCTGGTVLDEVLVPVSVDRADVYPIGAYCPLRYFPDTKDILAERAEYLAWWVALNALAADLFDQLESIAVLSPSAAQKPWLGERESGKPPRLFEDLSARIYQREKDRVSAAAHRSLGQRRVLSARRGIPATVLARMRHPAPQAAQA